MKKNILFFICLVSILLSPTVLLAASTDFTIRTLIGSDTMPPTTPALTSVVPVAQTQINLNWSAVTDDVAVGGYRVFRNAIQIATTTLLAYSDTGLSPSTTYSYNVDAFDTFFNFSSSSVIVATTTLAVPVISPTATATTQSNSSTRTVSAKDLQIVTTNTTALFSWQTVEQTQYTLAWGRTFSYELGIVSGTIFNQNHSTNINGLEPGTSYYYQLQAVDVRGTNKTISEGTFTTKSGMRNDAPPNVRQFSAVAVGNDVQLHWVNTFIDSTAVVRVVRSHLFYPGTIDAGALVYQGKAESFFDTDALRYRSPQYYTIFVIDHTSRVSSGAVALVKLTTPSQSPPVVPEVIVSTTEAVPQLIEDFGKETILSTANISVLQNDTTFRFDAPLLLDKLKPYLIRIPYSAVAKNLKSIIVSVQNPSNQLQISAYLLKLNPVGDAYEALIPAPQVVGKAKIMIEVFDYEQQTVRRIATYVTFVNNEQAIPFFPDQIIRYLQIIIPGFIFLLLCYFVNLLLKRRRKYRVT